MAFSIGVWRESGRRIAVGVICWMIFGVSMLTNGFWPMGHPPCGQILLDAAAQRAALAEQWLTSEQISDSLGWTRSSAGESAG